MASLSIACTTTTYFSLARERGEIRENNCRLERNASELDQSINLKIFYGTGLVRCYVYRASHSVRREISGNWKIGGPTFPTCTDYPIQTVK